MANLVYNFFKQAVMFGSYKLSNDQSGTTPIFISLVSNTYSPDGDLHKYRSSLTDIVTPSNYTAFFALSSPLLTQDNTNNQGVLDASDILMANVTFGTSVRGCVLWASTPQGSASDPLIAYIDFTTDQTVTAGTFQIQWAAGGILALT